MVSLSTWLRYVANKIEYSASICWKKYTKGNISKLEVHDAIWKNVFQGKLTYLHWTKGEEMFPMLAERGSTLLVRKLPAPDSMHVFVGDVVVMKDPEDPGNLVVRRLAAIEGCEMVSTDKKEEPFVLGADQCWVLVDNEKLKPKDAYDSRTFGPIPMSDIIGRVIYCLRTAVDHGPVENSHLSCEKDFPVLEVELDVDEMTRNHKA